jgi:hypothetical protein
MKYESEELRVFHAKPRRARKERGSGGAAVVWLLIVELLGNGGHKCPTGLIL